MELKGTYNVLIENKQQKDKLKNLEKSDIQPLLFDEYPCVVYGKPWHDGSGIIIIFYKVDSLEYSNYDEGDVIKKDEFNYESPNMTGNKLYSLEVFTSVLNQSEIKNMF